MAETSSVQQPKHSRIILDSYRPYDSWLEFAPIFEAITLENILFFEPSIGKRIHEDGAALSSEGLTNLYGGLESDLIGYISSAQSHGIAARNELVQKFEFVMDYLALLERKFDVNSKILNDLKLKITESLVLKSSYRAGPILKKSFIGLYREAERSVRQEIITYGAIQPQQFAAY